MAMDLDGWLIMWNKMDEKFREQIKSEKTLLESIQKVTFHWTAFIKVFI